MNNILFNINDEGGGKSDSEDAKNESVDEDDEEEFGNNVEDKN